MPLMARPQVSSRVLVVVHLPGDFDLDGDVDDNDLLAWQTGFGTNIGATHMDGDGDGDGDVDGNDFLIWQSQFGSSGSSAGASPALGAVPEPTASALQFVFAALVILLRCARMSGPAR